MTGFAGVRDGGLFTIGFSIVLAHPQSNPDHSNENLGKAGRNRHMGKRPSVRGVVMNPVDHPMGGGEGRSSGGRHPCTPWGKPTKGYKTRKNKRTSRFIVRRRDQGRRRK